VSHGERVGRREEGNERGEADDEHERPLL